tara:strand:- start:298 stop:1026 length:729 start_codon:yes stop_codon:yes gene_type:complete
MLDDLTDNMKTKCFGIHLTFGESNVDALINESLVDDTLGYVCIVDINVITNSFKNKNYNSILNNASFNTCDGSFLAFLRNLKYNTKLSSYNGPDIFRKYIAKEHTEQLIVGANQKDFEDLKLKLGNASHINFIPLPVCNADEFDYVSISKQINQLKPKIIWVLLGAPKQEIFINRIVPLTQRGLFFGAGAALEFYLGRLNNYKFSIYGLRFIWLNRLIKEPKKQLKRIFTFLLVLPKIIREA